MLLVGPACLLSRKESEKSGTSPLVTQFFTFLCTANSGGGLDRILTDARSAVAYLRQYAGIQKVILFGHSGGATLMTAYQLIAENGVKACQGSEKLTKCGDNLR